MTQIPENNYIIWPKKFKEFDENLHTLSLFKKKKQNAESSLTRTFSTVYGLLLHYSYSYF